MIATTHFTNNKWVALPSLTVDFFIGKMQPNEYHITENCIAFVQNTDTSTLVENQIVYGCLHYKYDEYGNEYQLFEIKDYDGKSHNY